MNSHNSISIGMERIHKMVFIRVAEAAVSLSPSYISAKLSAEDAVGIAKMTYSAMTTKRSSGNARRTKSMTPSATSGLTINLTKATP